MAYLNQCLAWCDLQQLRAEVAAGRQKVEQQAPAQTEEVRARLALIWAPAPQALSPHSLILRDGLLCNAGVIHPEGPFYDESLAMLSCADAAVAGLQSAAESRRGGERSGGAGCWRGCLRQGLPSNLILFCIWTRWTLYMSAHRLCQESSLSPVVFSAPFALCKLM